MNYSSKILSRDRLEISVPPSKRTTADIPLCVRRASSWADLIATAETDDIELVLWKRSELASFIATQHHPTSECESLFGTSHDILGRLNATLNAGDWPNSLQKIAERDIRAFLDACEATLSGTQYRLRLQAISDDACRKFHQDKTFQRLIITYRGSGTVWRHVNAPTEHEAIEMECVLLRGKRPGRNAQIHHRSPRFTTGQASRLIMVIDVLPSRHRPEA